MTNVLAYYKLDNYTPKIIEALMQNGWRYNYYGSKKTIQSNMQLRPYIYLLSDHIVDDCYDYHGMPECVDLETLLDIIEKPFYSIENNLVVFARPVTLMEVAQVLANESDEK